MRSSDDEDVVREYVRAWGSSAALLRTLTGPDARRLATIVRALRDGGLERATVQRVRSADSAVAADVSLHLGDGARLELPIRTRVSDDRVVAEPSAVASELDAWTSLRIDRFGSPHAGVMLSRDGAPLDTSRRAMREPAALIRDEMGARLSGHRGARLVTVGSKSVLASTSVRDGTDVVTSLDENAQAAAENALGDAFGALVAVDPRTGGIRAFVSRSLPSSSRSPATTASSPGSTFKIVTAAAALEGGILEPEDRVPCPASIDLDERRVTNFGNVGYGTISFERALVVSCNTAFARIGIRVGTSRLLHTVRALGFDVGELHATDNGATIAVPRSRGELGVWAFGEEGSEISPLRMAGIGATIARGGITMRPGWTDRGNAGARAISMETASTLVRMMEDVVESGTGTNARVTGVRVAGKTGTADSAWFPGRSDAWFVGLAPSRMTEIVAVAYLPGAGLGGRGAATVISRFFRDVVRSDGS